MTFNLIERNARPVIPSQYVYLRWVTYIIAVAILSADFIFSLDLPSYFNIILTVAIIINLLSIIKIRKLAQPVDFLIKGELDLNQKGIQVNESHFNFKDLEDLRFDIHDYKNMPTKNDGFSVSAGVNNIISFKENGKEKQYDFQIDSKSQFEKLGQYIAELYEYDFHFSEYFQNKISYGLRHLSYDEIQAFKKVYFRKD